jgi:hypothetical protein
MVFMMPQAQAELNRISTFIIYYQPQDELYLGNLGMLGTLGVGNAWKSIC